MSWVIVRNWQRFQHYHDRRPTWIKLYLDLRDHEGWEQLTMLERGLLVSIWLEWCAHDGVVSAHLVRQMVHRNVRQRALDSLHQAGFIEFSASKPLALAHVREEREKEKDLPKKVSKRKSTAGRRRAEHWIDAGAADEVPPAELWRFLLGDFGIDDDETVRDLTTRLRERTR